MSLNGKVVLVTGARQGLGKSISLGMAEAGADLVICDRVTDDGKLAETAKEIEALGKRALAISADVRLKDQVQNVMKRTADEFGTIDILVNNSGINIRCMLPEMTEEIWDSMIDTNVMGVFLYTQVVAPYMMKQKYGKIINMASMAGRGWNAPGTSRVIVLRRQASSS